GQHGRFRSLLRRSRYPLQSGLSHAAGDGGPVDVAPGGPALATQFAMPFHAFKRAVAFQWRALRGRQPSLLRQALHLAETGFPARDRGLSNLGEAIELRAAKIEGAEKNGEDHGATLSPFEPYRLKGCCSRWPFRKNTSMLPSLSRTA